MKESEMIKMAIHEEAMRRLKARNFSDKECRVILAAKFKALKKAWFRQFKAVQ